MQVIPLWIILAFLSPILLGINLVVNKIILSKYITDSVSYLMLVLLSNIVFLFPAYFILDTRMKFMWILYSLIIGIIFGLSFYFQNKVFEIEEASKVAILTRLTPIFIIPLAVLFLNEVLTFNNYLGVILLAAGGMMISAKEINLKIFKFTRTIIFISIFNFIMACTSIARKFVLNYNDFWPFFYWTNVGNFLGGILLMTLKNERDKFLKYLKSMDRKVYFLRVSTLITYLLSSLFTVIAVKQGYVTIVSGIFSIQPLIVMAYTTSLTVFFPRIIKEDVSRASIMQKTASLILVIVGSWLVII